MTHRTSDLAELPIEVVHLIEQVPRLARPRNVKKRISDKRCVDIRDVVARDDGVLDTGRLIQTQTR